MEFELQQAVEVLGRTPAVLRSMLEGLSSQWVMNNYGKGTFSAFDVIGHLIHGERTDWIPRARIILEHGPARTFDPFDRYAMYAQNKGKTLVQVLDEFEALRRENIAILQTMAPAPQDLDRPGTHPQLGAVTLRELLATWVVHDLNHIAQVAKAVAFQYESQVGAWRPFLTILGPPASRSAYTGRQA